MKKYYIGKMEITEEEARQQEQRNQAYMDSGDLALMFLCKFITVVNAE